MYTRKLLRNGRNGRALRGYGGFGDFNDETPCSSIPAGDPYRKPGNYCATADGGYVTFNADGSTYTVPVTSPPAGSILDKIGSAISGALNQRPVVGVGVPIMQPTGMSTTTKIVLAGGALLVVAMIARRR